jgi:hypothetical protein
MDYFRKEIKQIVIDSKDPLPTPLCSVVNYGNIEYECTCNGCQTKYDNLHCGIWCMCNICDRKIWFNAKVCTLYAWRLPDLVCFFCRYPFYKRNIKSGDIHRFLLKDIPIPGIKEESLKEINAEVQQNIKEFKLK